MWNQKGFTLLELMIVVLIIGILSAILYPSYNSYMREARRSDGAAFLLTIMQQQERYFTEELTYTDDLRQLGYSARSGMLSSGRFYKVSVERCGSLNYSVCIRLRAKPEGAQAGDGDLTLDSRGSRTGNWP
ncbi:Fimbrial protein [invertebrate metagenome]|uniref:Fimbrial protein n=1 Tax=invertebrate metagenome TaxID=1711999 RepID=A0A2H9T770_9ZZZZ